MSEPIFISKDALMYPYPYRRGQIRSGDLLAWSKNDQSFVSNLVLDVIKIATQSEFAHVGMAVWIGQRLCVFEATIPQVHIVPVSNYDTFFHIPMFVNWEPEYIDIIVDYLGISYSLGDCINAYTGAVLETSNGYQCAELMRETFLKFGIDLGDVYTPSELVYAALEKRNTDISLVNQMVK